MLSLNFNEFFHEFLHEKPELFPAKTSFDLNTSTLRVAMRISCMFRRSLDFTHFAEQNIYKHRDHIFNRRQIVLKALVPPKGIFNFFS